MDEALIQEKYRRLEERLRSLPSLAVSFSGGIDSALLLAAAAKTMGPERVIAVTARGANFPEREFAEAAALAQSLGVRHRILDFDPIAVPGFRDNPPDRCYHCKKALLESVFQAAREAGIAYVADGANTDDDGDYRPGMKAAAEAGVISPLREAGLGKQEIRELLRGMHIRGWDKPSLACLASRIPYGTPITREDLKRVDKAECFLLSLGFSNVRVRHHGDVARIEVPDGERNRLLGDAADATAAELRRLGYTFVAADLGGYRTGSMNVHVPQHEK